MSERAVGVRHAMRVFAFLHGGTAIVGRVDELVRQTHRHALLRTRTRGVDRPTHRERLAAGRADMAVVDIHDLGLARAAGRDVVGVGALVQRPLAAVIAGAARRS